MTGSYDEWDEARRLVERGERKLSDYGGELPGIKPPEQWRRYFLLAAPVEPVRVRLRRVVRSGAAYLGIWIQRLTIVHRFKGAKVP